jgi:hypothetical protein
LYLDDNPLTRIPRLGEFVRLEKLDLRENDYFAQILNDAARFAIGSPGIFAHVKS